MPVSSSLTQCSQWPPNNKSRHRSCSWINSLGSQEFDPPEMNDDDWADQESNLQLIIPNRWCAMTGQKYITTTVNIIIISSSSAAERGELWESILKQIFWLLSNRSKKEMPFTKLNLSLSLPPLVALKHSRTCLGIYQLTKPLGIAFGWLAGSIRHSSWAAGIKSHIFSTMKCDSWTPFDNHLLLPKIPLWTEQDDDQNDVNSYYNQSVSQWSLWDTDC